MTTIKQDTSEAVVTLLRSEQQIHLSDMFIKFWTGQERPPEELQLWLKDRGYQIVPGTDHRGGWLVQPLDSESASGLLFPCG